MRPAHPSRPLSCRVLPLVLAAVAGAPMPAAADDAVGAVPYRLGVSSAYEEGCFEPCLCPIMMSETLQGTFLLSPPVRDGDTAVHSVLDVAWTYQSGDLVIAVAGSGTYTREADGQRLVLDLVAGEGTARHYDSGFVPAPRDLPQIDIAVSVNGFFCYDTVFVVVALPAGVAVEPSSWGALKATYR